MNELRKILESQVSNWEIIGHHALLERYALKYGVDFVGVDRPKDVRRRTPKQCYMNAAKMAERGFEYYEGFAMSKRIGFPFGHAWNVRNLEVVDTTLDYASEYIYLGMPFDLETLHLCQRRTGVYGVLDSGLGINTDLLRNIDADLFKQATKGGSHVVL